MSPSASLLSEDNTRVGVVPLEEAVRSGESFYVDVRAGVLAADFDDPDKADLAEKLYWASRMAGLRAVLVASGQPGRRHVFAWGDGGPPPAWLAELAKKLGGDVRQHIRPPLAPHRLWRAGVTPTLLLPAGEPDDFLAELAADRSRVWGPALRGRVLDGHGGTYKTNSEFLYAVAVGAVNAGWSVDEALRMLDGAGTAAAAAYRTRADRRPEAAADWFRTSVWPKALTYVRENPAVRTEPDPRLAELATAAARAWPGLGGASDRLVYQALLEKARRIGEMEVNASQRELMVLTGLSSRVTVGRALSRLQNYQLIERRARRDLTTEAGPVSPRASYRWRLLPPISPAGPRAAAPLLPVGTAHDAWQNGPGLGKNAQRVWEMLRQAPHSRLDEISERVGLTRRTVRRHLARLAEFHLARAGEDELWEALDGDLDTIASDLGTLGNAERRSKRINEERELYDEEREHRRRGRPDHARRGTR